MRANNLAVTRRGNPVSAAKVSVTTSNLMLDWQNLVPGCSAARQSIGLVLVPLDKALLPMARLKRLRCKATN